MNTAFVVVIRTDIIDPNQLTLEAEDIHSGLQQLGFDVVSVNPYDRPSLGVNLPGTNPLSQG